MPHAEPFRLVATMATPVALNHPWLHLDGVVGHLMYLRALGREYYLLPTKTVRHIHQREAGRFHRTLARYGEIPRASVSWFAPEKLGSLQYFKRFEAEGFPARRKVVIGNGHFRSWMLRTIYQATHTVTFYGCGDLARVRELAEELTHLGDNTRAGWGRIHALAIAPLTEDRSIVWDGRAQRPIPVRLCRRAAEAVPLAWRPPYWAAENVEPCAPPGAEVEL